MIAAFGGWNDAAAAASGAVVYIGEQFGARRVASIDPEDFYDFQATRPLIDLSTPDASSVMWPEVELLVARPPAGPHDLLLVAGAEPSMRWQTFSRVLLDAAESLGVKRVVLLGSLLADVVHSHPVRPHGHGLRPVVHQRPQLPRPELRRPHRHRRRAAPLRRRARPGDGLHLGAGVALRRGPHQLQGQPRAGPRARHGRRGRHRRRRAGGGRRGLRGPGGPGRRVRSRGCANWWSNSRTPPAGWRKRSIRAPCRPATSWPPSSSDSCGSATNPAEG